MTLGRKLGFFSGFWDLFAAYLEVHLHMWLREFLPIFALAANLCNTLGLQSRSTW